MDSTDKEKFWFAMADMLIPPKGVSQSDWEEELLEEGANVAYLKEQLKEMKGKKKWLINLLGF